MDVQCARSQQESLTPLPGDAVIVHRQVDRFLLVLIPVGIFVYLSTRPLMRLQEDPPSEFIRSEPGWNASRRAVEEQLARAYWKCAVDVLQWQHSFGKNLSGDPPSEFRIDPSNFPDFYPGGPAAARARYWRRLQMVWILPHAWRKSYEWSTAWVTDLWVSIRDGIESIWERPR